MKVNICSLLIHDEVFLSKAGCFLLIDKGGVPEDGELSLADIPTPIATRL